MLELKVRDGDVEVVLQFEHSLLSLSKWESKHKKAFLASTQKLPSEMIDYFQAMIMTPDVDENLVYLLSPEQMDELARYINEPQTASSVPEETDSKGPVETVTSELMYYWFTALKIPFQPTETWHLSRASMLVQIASFKQKPEKKRSTKAVLSDWAAINRQRLEKYNTKG